MAIEPGRALEILRERRQPDGGFGSRPSLAAEAGSTAWAAFALVACGAPREDVRSSLAWLAHRQLADGRIPLAPDQPDVIWPTPVVMLAWLAAGSDADRLRKAAQFLLSHTGRHQPRESDSPVGHDTSLRGWPWVLGTHSWVTPTSLCVLALCRAGYRSHPRIAEAVRMLRDRQLPGGGWNYGNTTVFGQSLRPLPDTTGVALCALAGLADRATVEPSLGYLERILTRIRTPLSLGWGLLGLASWDVRPAAADAWIEETLQREAHFGPYETSSLAVLLLAARSPGGLTGRKEG
ncbi:MAG TPA: prenyltransferase/squalene oxidase repeat-containing protein [Bryobacteraceae bacterium]|nr:prenyltransferase/squalene oxidase repeat-containing protein [Bryobacteraceae bacterium]